MMVESAIKFDFQQAFDRLDGLAKVAKEHLPRSMAVAAGTVFRDEAKARAPRSDGGTVTDVGPRLPLAESIYLAYSDSRSIPEQGMASYGVTWNSRKAPHGHLLEFGYWQRYAVFKDKNGNWRTDISRPLSSPKWVQAHPFLRPAYDAAVNIALQAAMDRGKQRMGEILADPSALEQYKK